MGEKILIIGGVAAGPKTACRVKRLMPDAEVTVIDQDSLISYGGCGIPYFVSGDVSDEKELRSTSFHAVRDEAFFNDAKGVSMLTRTKALAIGRQTKKVQVENLDTGEKNDLPYDKLVLATGSSPNRLQIPGADLQGVYVVNDMHRAMAIKNDLALGKVAKAVVIGGGAIGLEMAESLADLWGIETTVLEYMDQLLPRMVDPAFAAMLEKHFKDNNVSVYTGESATSLEGNDSGRVCRVITPNRTIEADLVIMSVGVRPRSELAKEAGLQVSTHGGIEVNNSMQTSDPDIYAAGDCVEIINQVSGMKNIAPMGSLANRQGRIVADNIAGIPSQFEGWVGSFIMKAFDSCIGGTGLSYSSAKALDFDAGVAITAQSDRAHFFPTQAVIMLQMIFDKTNRKVLGIQGFGPMNDSILARINAGAGLIARGATIEDFSNLELAYAPPFSTAVDALNATANVADNIAAGRLRTVSIEDFMNWMDNPHARPDWAALDIRHPKEAEEFIKTFGSELWKAIPYVNVRSRFQELPDDKMLIIICDAGTRSSEVQTFLDSIGLTNNLVLGGGFNAIRRIGAEWWPSQ
jgi:NADPH-dependent 2,4-dienoyl-CoA reductase/sulfur reductase-like enzyme/rhodanese-related sulfurtransferase